MMRTAILLVLAAAGCGARSGEPVDARTPPTPPTAAQAPAAAAQEPRRIPGWRGDFPVSVRLPQHKAQGRWDRSPRQALEAVAANLTGACTRDAWLFAKEFFARVDDDDLDVLVEFLDRALQSPVNSDDAENALEAAARARRAVLAPAILRAIPHQKAAVRLRAVQALASSGTAAAVASLQPMLPQFEPGAQVAWLEAARVQLGPDVVAAFRALLADPRHASLQSKVVEEALRLPVELARETLRPLWTNPPPNVRPALAGLLHAGGEGGGTAVLNDLLQSEAPADRAAALGALRFGGADTFREQALRLTIDPDPDVRLAAVSVIATLPGEEVDLALEAGVLDESVAVHQAALHGLSVRGTRRGPLDELVDAVRKGTGSKVGIALADIVVARDAKAIPAIVERMASAPDDEQRQYLQALAHMRLRESFAPLWEVFLADERELGSSDSQLGSHDYVALLLTNLPAEDRMLAGFDALPKADVERRALMLGTLAGIAVDREDPALAEQVRMRLRAVLHDRSEIPQMRLLALQYLHRHLRIEDALAIARGLRDEEPAMRAVLNDFLSEFF
jgi:hypothetical protein